MKGKTGLAPANMEPSSALKLTPTRCSIISTVLYAEKKPRQISEGLYLGFNLVLFLTELLDTCQIFSLLLVILIIRVRLICIWNVCSLKHTLS